LGGILIFNIVKINLIFTPIIM